MTILFSLGFRHIFRKFPDANNPSRSAESTMTMECLCQKFYMEITRICQFELYNEYIQIIYNFYDLHHIKYVAEPSYKHMPSMPDTLLAKQGLRTESVCKKRTCSHFIIFHWQEAHQPTKHWTSCTVISVVISVGFLPQADPPLVLIEWPSLQEPQQVLADAREAIIGDLLSRRKAGETFLFLSKEGENNWKHGENLFKKNN